MGSGGSMPKSYGIHWFRRDLRVLGNKALRENFIKNEGRVLCIFTFDKKFLSRDDFSANRFQFFLKSLEALKKDLKEMGGDLITLDVGPQRAYKDFFKELKEKGSEKPSLITWNRDYEPFARDRDQGMKAFFKKEGVEVKDFRDHLIIEPHELFRDKPENGYQVFTPFSKKWLNIIREPEFSKRISGEKSPIAYLKEDKKKVFNIESLKTVLKAFPNDVLAEYSKENAKSVTVPIPAAGFGAAVTKALAFKKKIEDYGLGRDFPIDEKTSGLSVFFKNGTITTSQIIKILGLKPYTEKQTSEDVFLSELIWREFYYHVLFRNPRVENEEFNQKYIGLKWANDKALFEKWKDGLTGYPIVDAGMRQLKETGLMHNRVRMVVASFLTKHLLTDWRWGEKHFMETLLDGDLAPNNGGWQWAASTGCDAQPYFRIFNPFLQSKKFDKEGEYIKKYVPELRDVEAKKLHAPVLGHAVYPEPIVDHKECRERALSLYKAVK